MIATRTDIRREDPPGKGALFAPGEILESVSIALNSTLELPEVLRILAGIVLEACEADRCSIFLLDSGRLVPTASRGLESDEDLWKAFREMDDLRIEDLQGARDFLCRGEPLGIVDAQASCLIPEAWAQRFGLKSLIVVPLLVAGEPCGVMAVDSHRERVATAEEIGLLKAIGSYAAVAIRNAKLFAETCRRASWNESLARVAAHLISPLPMDRLAEELLEATQQISPSADYCLIGIVDEGHDHIEAIASRGVASVCTPLPIAKIPGEIVSTLRSSWDDDDPIEFDADRFISGFLGIERGDPVHCLLPIRAESHVTGGILLGGVRFRLGAEERAALKALASIAAAALERIWLLKRMDRQLRQMQVLHDTGEMLSRRMTAEGLVDRVNALLKDESFWVESVCFRGGAMARHLGGAMPSSTDRLLWKEGVPQRTDGALWVPMRLSGRMVGSVRIRPEKLPAEDLSFVLSLADGLAQLASRAAMRAEAEESEREVAISAERGRIAAQLHETVAQDFLAIGILAQQALRAEASGSEIAEVMTRISELADSGKWDVDHAVRWLALFPEARGGIVPALEALKDSFEADNGLPIVFDRHGSPRRLSPGTERALYRVACGALNNACRHGGSTAIRMDLRFDKEAVTLTVVDDGSGASTRQLDHRARSAVADMRAALAGVGGSFRLTSTRPRGIVVSAEIPSEAR